MAVALFSLSALAVPLSPFPELNLIAGHPPVDDPEPIGLNDGPYDPAVSLMDNGGDHLMGEPIGPNDGPFDPAVSLAVGGVNDSQIVMDNGVNTSLWWSCDCADQDPRMTSKYDLFRGIRATGLMAAAYHYEALGRNQKSSYTSKDRWMWWYIRYLKNVQYFIDSNGAAGFVANLYSDIIVGFAGTDFTDINDVIADLSSIIPSWAKLGSKSYLVGSGFYDHYTALMRNGMETALNSLLAASSTKRVFVVGHSLGGAIADIAAVDLANKFGASVVLHTAGAPRSFKRDYADQLQRELVTSSSTSVFPRKGKINTNRWLNYNDPIPAALGNSGVGLLGYGSAFGFKHWGGGLYVRTPFSFYCPTHTCPMKVGIEAQDFTPWNGVAGNLHEYGFNHMTSAYNARIRRAYHDRSKNT